MRETERQNLELHALSWMVETFDPNNEGSSRKCRKCRLLWLGIGMVSSSFVLVSLKFDLVDPRVLLFFSALAGASFTACRLMTESALTLQIVGRFVDIKGAKERLEELRSQSEQKGIE